MGQHLSSLQSQYDLAETRHGPWLPPNIVLVLCADLCGSPKPECFIDSSCFIGSYRVILPGMEPGILGGASRATGRLEMGVSVAGVSRLQCQLPKTSMDAHDGASLLGNWYQLLQFAVILHHISELWSWLVSFSLLASKARL